MPEPHMPVEVAYASLTEQVIFNIDVPQNATIEMAIHESGVLEQFPEIDLSTTKVGIFGHAESLNATLNAQDRVEIYRPITCDPKEVRKQRARKKAPEKKPG